MKVVVGSFQGSLLNIDSVRQEEEEGRGGGGGRSGFRFNDLT